MAQRLADANETIHHPNQYTNVLVGVYQVKASYICSYWPEPKRSLSMDRQVEALSLNTFSN